ncbi:MAG: hypothetical protein OXN20_12380 [Gemmatimonadota bacterium]|nr:hypothetical protein [Gemmatimonadota bacterium]
MNMFLKVMLSFVLCHLFGVLASSAEIPNHHIFYRQDKRAPLTSIEIVFLGAGKNQEQPSQIGLANTVSALIGEAAKKQGYLDQLSALGANLDIITHPLYQAISISALSENCGESIKMVFDFMRNLEFSNSDLQYAKKQEATDYQSGLRINTYTFMRTYALSQITGKKQFKSLKALKNFSLEDVRQYYDQLLKADVVFFKIISNRDSTEVAKLLHPVTKERETGGFVHSPKFSITDYNVGFKAFVYTDYSHLKSVFCHWMILCGGSVGEENYIPNLISNTLTGDERGLISKYFREELGLVYGPSCAMLSSGGIRYLNIYADPQLHNSEELIVKMSDFIRGLSDNPRFWEALKERRKILKVSPAHNLTPQRSLDREVNIAIYNAPYRKGGYDSVTDDEVRAFLEEFFVPENMIMIFVGPKDHIIDILNKHLPEVDIRVHDVKELIE